MIASAPAIARVLNRHGFVNKKNTIGEGYFIEQGERAVFVSMHLRSWSDQDVQRYNDNMDRINRILSKHGYTTETQFKACGLQEFKVSKTERDMKEGK